ncbi:MAG: thioredoxin domain-containing protein, partial [Desulfuromonadales bacterium]
MVPAFAQPAATLEPCMRLATVNTEEQKALATRYAIKGLPSGILFGQGRKSARQSGAMSAADINNWRVHTNAMRRSADGFNATPNRFSRNFILHR